MSLGIQGALYLTLGGKLKLVASWYIQFFFLILLFVLCTLPWLFHCKFIIIICLCLLETWGFIVFCSSYIFCMYVLPSPCFCYYINNSCLWLPARLLHSRVPGHKSLVLQLSLSLVFRFFMQSNMFTFSFFLSPWLCMCVITFTSLILFCYNCSLSLWMRRVLRLKECAVDICVWKVHGLEHSELFTVIMKDMKPHTSNHSLATISVVMAVAGMLLQ